MLPNGSEGITYRKSCSIYTHIGRYLTSFLFNSPLWLKVLGCRYRVCVVLNITFLFSALLNQPAAEAERS